MFDKEHKKEIPFFPEKIAVVTSETGAAVRDILKIIKSRNNYVDVLIYPVLVQGPSAAGEIAHAIADINEKWPDMDTIITGRGGGAMEELWAFNEEIVARSIYASKIPVISAVGHETDFTIADFVADRRAETPTAAAHMAVPDIEELKGYIETLKQHLESGFETGLKYRSMHLERLNLDVFKRDLESRITVEQMRLEAIHTENLHSIRRQTEAYEKKLQLLRESLEAFNPKAILARGYGAVLDSGRRFVKTAGQIRKGDKMIVALSDGEVDCITEDVRRGEQ